MKLTFTVERFFFLNYWRCFVVLMEMRLKWWEDVSQRDIQGFWWNFKTETWLDFDTTQATYETQVILITYAFSTTFQWFHYYISLFIFKNKLNWLMTTSSKTLSQRVISKQRLFDFFLDAQYLNWSKLGSENSILMRLTQVTVFSSWGTYIDKYINSYMIFIAINAKNPSIR